MKHLYLTLFVFGLSLTLYSQTPGIPYQAVLMDKNMSGTDLPGLDDQSVYPLINSLVALRFSIHDVDL